MKKKFQSNQSRAFEKVSVDQDGLNLYIILLLLIIKLHLDYKGRYLNANNLFEKHIGHLVVLSNSKKWLQEENH